LNEKSQSVFAFACGECGVFANSLKRIGKWQRLLPFAEANAFAHHSPYAIEIGRRLISIPKIIFFILNGKRLCPMPLKSADA